MSSLQRSPAEDEGGLSQADRALLQRRAERLARVADRQEVVHAEVLLFERGRGRYAVPIEALREIRPLRELCPLPGASAVVPGVVYHRGEILSVHDLAAFLAAAEGAAEPAWVLVAECDGLRLGLLADAVHDVEAVGSSRLRDVPLNLGDEAACFSGVLDGRVMLLHPPALFRHDRFRKATPS